MASGVKEIVARATQSVRRRAWDAREGLRRRGSKVIVEGQGNEIDLGKSRLHTCRIEVRGNHNLVRIHPSCKLVNVSFRLLGDNLRLELGERVKVSQWGEFLLMGEDAEIRLDHHCTVESARFIAHSGTVLEVGPDCMFANDVEVRTSDEHSILDASSGARINPDRRDIGEHVWLGHAHQGGPHRRRSVIATGSIVSRDLGAGVVAAGIPAREIRQGVTWDRRRL